MPDEPEAIGLLALMLLHDARREARVEPDGDLVLLEDQDRVALGRGADRRGAARSSHAVLPAGRPGPYQVQAAIAALHDEAPDRRDDRLAPDRRAVRRAGRIAPSPVVELNRAVAVAMADGPAAGLALIDGLAAEGALAEYPYFHAARADLLRRLGRRSEAADAYRRALELTTNEPSAVPRAPPRRARGRRGGGGPSRATALVNCA